MVDINFGIEVKNFRKQAKMSQEVFAENVGISADYVSKIEKGQREPSEIVKKAIVYFMENPEIKVRPIGAFSVPPSVSKIPIVSWTQAGPDGFFVDSHAVGTGFGEINRPYDVTDPNAYALIISGDSMAPKFEAGDIVVVSPERGVQVGDYAVVKLTNGSVMAKRVKAKNGTFIFESVNPDYNSVECKKEEISFMHRIVWVKQRG